MCRKEQGTALKYIITGIGIPKNLGNIKSIWKYIKFVILP